MYTEARKLYLIEAILKTKNEAVLKAIEGIVENTVPKEMTERPKAKFSELIGVLTDDEAEAMKQTVEETFEKINPDDWK